AGRRVPERPRAEVVAAWDWIARRRGRGSVDALARYVALSPRQLRTLFHREVGLGPKAVSGLFRFDHAKRLVATLPDGMTLAEVAQRCGYADQAHLVHDFRRYTGTTPSGWLAEERRNIQDGAYPDRTGCGHGHHTEHHHHGRQPRDRPGPQRLAGLHRPGRPRARPLPRRRRRLPGDRGPQ